MKSNLSFSPEEHVAKKDADHEPKFSFEEVNDDEEDSSGTVWLYTRFVFFIWLVSLSSSSLLHNDVQ